MRWGGDILAVYELAPLLEAEASATCAGREADQLDHQAVAVYGATEDGPAFEPDRCAAAVRCCCAPVRREDPEGDPHPLIRCCCGGCH